MIADAPGNVVERFVRGDGRLVYADEHGSTACYALEVTQPSDVYEKRAARARRAEARRKQDDWTVGTFRSFEEAREAEIEAILATPPEERFRLVFELSGQLGRSDLPRSEWPVGILRFEDES